MSKVVLEVNKKLERPERLQLLHGIPELEWRAVVETLLLHLESVTQYVSDPNETNVMHYAGGVAALRLLIADLEDSRSEGGKTS